MKWRDIFKADTVDSTFNGGIYEDGSTDLRSWAVEGGYMLPGNMLEVGAAYHREDRTGSRIKRNQRALTHIRTREFLDLFDHYPLSFCLPVDIQGCVNPQPVRV